MIKDALHGILHPTNTMLLNTMHTNPMDMVIHIMDMKILHHHTHLLKLASKKLFSCYVRKGNQKRIDDQVTTLQLSVIRLMIQFTNNNINNSSIASQPLNSGDLPSQPLSSSSGSIPTLFLCANQERRGDALLHEEDVESLNHEEVHECLEEVEEENEDQEAEDVDQEVEDKDKEPKGMEIVHSTLSEATRPKLPSELHFA
ncbi:hypothetical protein PIB30_106084 [Stylosanthes scabra]|uniref:Uncharacterized protein n=1 Tax=Stylosanthes scabra TaxID=79078 RepID=A0ABU6ZXG5_9FABA|nr:hypothetical protein [Stylosanthes scabra]